VTTQITSENLAYRNFIHSLRSSFTKINYVRSLGYFMGYLKIDCNDYEKLLSPPDAKLIQSNIINFLVYLRDKGNSPNTISSYLAAIKHFYDMNDIILNWKKIKSFKGEFYRVVDDEAYTAEQIKLLVDNADMRDKAIILLMTSTDMRARAIPKLKIKDLSVIDEYHIYKIIIYKKTHEQYYTFCTPEAKRALDDYLDYRRRSGERLKEDTPLFRKRFSQFEPTNPQPISFNGLISIIFDLLNKTGVRPLRPQQEGQISPKRTSLPMTHGFRKFAITNMIRAGVEFGARERLVGHKLAGTDPSYDRRDETEILEQYLKAIDYLTINEENKLRRKVETLNERQDEIQKMKDKHEQEMKSMREEINQQFNQIMSMIQQNPKLSQVKLEALVKKKL